ncbi:hydroxypyruvate isomerase family protein [Thalassoglobus polymorphus]|uniref:Hydroxypyruvate isomerase n=1 Tax=Thalassoglobus polymorphus TaxID=2527994 RepID=A0A517QJ04_9PLAN|nr:TIM barrel protein [Thalassoglobus polymorphus]QDT31629.1 Hydroxypyruvate isomerase [Thalassoglobus polymorphus]
MANDQHSKNSQPSGISRRDWMRWSASSVAAAVAVGSQAVGSQTAEAAKDQETQGKTEPVAKNNRIKQSLVNWCYNKAWPDVDEYCNVAVRLGCQSIELIDPKHWPTLKKHGLTCAISGSHGFQTGFNNRDEWDECLARLRERIRQCKEFGVKSVITFTGMANGLSKEDGAKNCVEGLKKIAGDAEKNDVTVCLEMLNTRDDSHPMKGHPGYQGDHCDYCIDILKEVGSSHVKLLFDIYHVQIMDGDVIRRIREHKDWLGHIHTAGNPGRAELDDVQEINYPAVMKALLDVGYTGYVGQEFIPTRDPWGGLAEAVALCDV